MQTFCTGAIRKTRHSDSCYCVCVLCFMHFLRIFTMYELNDVNDVRRDWVKIKRGPMKWTTFYQSVVLCMHDGCNRASPHQWTIDATQPNVYLSNPTNPIQAITSMSPSFRAGAPAQPQNQYIYTTTEHRTTHPLNAQIMGGTRFMLERAQHTGGMRSNSYMHACTVESVSHRVYKYRH